MEQPFSAGFQKDGDGGVDPVGAGTAAAVVVLAHRHNDSKKCLVPLALVAWIVLPNGHDVVVGVGYC